MNRWIALLTLLGFSLPTMAQGVYTWVDGNGVTHFGDAPGGRQATRVEVNAPPPSSTPGRIAIPQPSGGSEKPAANTKHKIIMYGTSWCGVCKRARRYFSKNHIDYTEYDVDKTAKGKHDYRAMNGKAVPIFLVDGQRYNGFSASHFNQLLGL